MRVGGGGDGGNYACITAHVFLLASFQQKLLHQATSVRMGRPAINR